MPKLTKYYCVQCGVGIIPGKDSRRVRKFCSVACRSRYYRTPGNGKGITLVCEREECRKEFEVYPSATISPSSGKPRRFCSHECRWKVLRGKTHPLYKGLQTNGRGYLFLKKEEVPEQFWPMCTESGRLLVHRLVKAHELGRCLEQWEVVHHIDGDKQNNDPSNLELHNSHEHVGITTLDNVQIAKLKRENAKLKRVGQFLYDENKRLEREIVMFYTLVLELAGKVETDAGIEAC